MTTKVLLVQRGISSQSHAVSGKSQKNYGNALYDASRGGVVFELSADDYHRNAHDLIGNVLAGQQWVPEFIESSADGKRDFGFCCSPSCRLGQGGKAADASYVSGRSLFCATHAPLDATPLFPGAPRIGSKPEGNTETELAPDVQPQMRERVGGQMQEKGSDGYTPPERMAAPIVGSAAEASAPLFGGVEKPVPMPQLPKAVKTDDNDNPAFIDPASNEAGQESKPSPLGSGAPEDKGPALLAVIGKIVEQQITGLEQRLMTAVQAITGPKASGNGSTHKRHRRPASKAAAEPTDFQRLQKDAKGLGIAIFGKGKEALQKEIDEKLAEPAASEGAGALFRD